MSKMSGDTARFNRLRKEKIRKRAQSRVLRAELMAPKVPAAAVAEKPKA